MIFNCISINLHKQKQIYTFFYVIYYYSLNLTGIIYYIPFFLLLSFSHFLLFCKRGEKKDFHLFGCYS